MIYPSHLLPQKNYKKIEMSEELSNCTILRITSSNDILMEGTKKINPVRLKENLQTKEFPDLSINLYSIYKLEDIKIKVIAKSFFSLWEEGSEISIPIYETDFILDENKGYVFFCIKDILELEIPISLSNETFSIKLEVIHVPTKCNFWHFETRVYKDGISVNSEDIPKGAWKTIRNFLSLKAFGSLEHDPYLLPEEYYIA